MIYNKLFQYLWMRRAPRFRGKIVRYRCKLDKNERLSPENLQQLQWDRLKQLLAYAYSNVSFYRHRFDKIGLHPSTIKTPQDFERIPVLTRQDIQAHLNDLVASNCNIVKLRRNTTSGSTGNPTVFYQDTEHMAWHEAARLRRWSWVDFEMGDKVAYLWGASRDIAKSTWLRRQRIRYVDRTLWLNAFDITTERMEHFAHQLIRWQPKYIISYVSSLYLFAGFLQARKLDGQIRPVAIETSAEKLWGFQRKLIEEVFQCPVIDAYGSRELPIVAANCRDGKRLHIFNDICYLEIIRNQQSARPGEIGEIVVTDLNNYGMPLIRYQNGDLARTSEKTCPCKRPFPLLEEVIGRSNTLISTPSGRYVHGAFLSYLLYSISGVQSFQIHQKSLAEITITIERNGHFSERVKEDLCRKIGEQLGPGIDLNLQIVDKIARTPTGKHNYIISEVPLPFVSN